MYTKKMSQGNGGMGGGDIFLGNTAYIIGSIFILFGMLALYFNKKYQKDIAVKCPKCKETFNYKDTLNGKCPHCKDVDTIELKEYYDKFPDEKKE
ncbi:MAG: hypothetical protein PHI02_00470 [Sulfurovaceae bacterium]|nr:hypothetical protein [Sulfurovaceae bacterium]